MNQLQASHLAAFLKGCDSFFNVITYSKLIINEEDGQFNFTARPLDYTEWLGNYWLGFSIDDESQQTLVHLKTLVGEKRLQRIFSKPELGLEVRLSEVPQIFLTPSIIHKIFIGLADITLADLEEAANGRGLQELEAQEIDALYEGLFPIRQVKELFEAYCVGVHKFDKPNTSGKGFQGLQERVWTIHQAKAQVETGLSSIERKAVETEFLTSRLGDREPPVGSLVRLKDGYYKIEKIFSAGGAHVSLFTRIGKGKEEHLLVCRGTAARYSASGGYLSGMNDILYELGFYGIKTIWPELKSYLHEQNIQQVTVMGKSLGGGQGQYLTVLLAGASSVSVSKLHTYCSVGAGPTQKIFDEIFAGKKEEEHPCVHAFRNSGNKPRHIDYIPTVGGPHLRSSQTSVHYVTRERDAEIEGSFMPEPEGLFQRIRSLLQSFSYGHTRQSTLHPFRVHLSQDTEDEINQGIKMEWLRMIGAVLFNAVTFGRFNSESFEDFYRREREIHVRK